MSKRIVVLMYHDLFDGERELSEIDAADRPYAVSIQDFRSQLDALQDAGLALLNPRDLTTAVDANGGVVLTFDDGHASNHRHALPELSRRGAAAAFFVTTDFIDRRRGFCNWSQLRELSAAGMTVGAHGRSHRFFDDLPEAEAKAEFSDPKSAIEQRIGCGVTQMSFPGGRYSREQLLWGEEAGYELMHVSDIGSSAARPLDIGSTLPRVAVKAGLSADRLVALASARPSAMLPARLVGAAKHGVRRVVGNRAYHAIYERLAG